MLKHVVAQDVFPELKLLTFCVLILKNGFTVTGESACASPENFNAEIGRKIARQNAVQKIRQLEWYLLREAGRMNITTVESSLDEADLWAEIYRLREAVKGPTGYNSWQEAAIDERLRRVKAERELKTLDQPEHDAVS